MKTALSFKQTIYLIIAAVVATLILSLIIFEFYTMSRSDPYWIGSLLGALGNFSGGIIGGIVAYLVASYQVSKLNAKEEERERLGSSALLKLLREELHDNLMILETILKHPTSDSKLLKCLSEDCWRTAGNRLIIPDELLVKLNVSYRKTIVLKGLPDEEITNEILERTKEQIVATWDAVGKEIEIRSR